MSVVTERLAGAEVLGTVMTGAWPAFAVTEGSVPPPVDTCGPDADWVPEYCCSRSITQTRVSVPLTPSCDSPVVPYAYFGGSTATTRLPRRASCRAFASPGRPSCAGMSWGPVEKVEYSSLCLVPLHLYSATSASRASPVLRVAPDPLIGVLMTRSALAFSAGMVTVGALPNEP